MSKMNKNFAHLFFTLLVLSSCSPFPYKEKSRNEQLTSIAFFSADQSATEFETDMLEMELIAYYHSVNTFTTISLEDLNKKLNNNEAFYLYVGRATCPWCRKIAPILSQVAESNHLNIYYLDSEGTNNNPELKKFRKKYNIKTVPAILVFSNKEKYESINFNEKENNESLKDQLTNALVY